MESSHKTKQRLGRWLLAGMLILILLCAYGQFVSPTASILSNRQDGETRLIVLTKPAMYVSYNPVSKKVTIKNIEEKRPPKAVLDRVRQLQSAESGLGKAGYLVPKETSQEKFWEEFKTRLDSWRYNPLLSVKYLWDYVNARHEKRTNLSVPEFLLYSLELTKLEVTDFAVKVTPLASKRQNKRVDLLPLVEDKAPLAVDDRPIVIEILNGSGRKGVALELTQYLRDLNHKGLLRVDVLQYDNYPSVVENTHIIDYSGRLAQVKQISTAVGCKNEILSEPKGNAICDTRIVIGKDFQMPL